jgi:hypothetical protein
MIVDFSTNFVRTNPAWTKLVSRTIYQNKIFFTFLEKGTLQIFVMIFLGITTITFCLDTNLPGDVFEVLVELVSLGVKFVLLYRLYLEFSTFFSKKTEGRINSLPKPTYCWRIPCVYYVGNLARI